MRLTIHFVFASIFVWCKLCNAYSSYYQEDIFEEYWSRIGRLEIEKSLKRPVNWNAAKNVIIMVGDGMDPNTITATRIYKEGEEGKLSFEEFPHLGLLKTYSIDKKVPDAAATGTALFTGVKTNNGVVGFDSRVRYDDCSSSITANVRTNSIMKWAQEAGKNTGFVTNKRVTDALASALYAHSANRYWECNHIPPQSQMCKDIGRQLVEDEPGQNFKVIFGGGRQCLVTNAPYSLNDKIDGFNCQRTDNSNLMDYWVSDKMRRNVRNKVIQNTAQLVELDIAKIEYALGIFSNSYMPFDVDRNTSKSGQPSLELMLEPAIKLLRKNHHGFVLMVEGGLIDKAHHEGHARRAVEETIEFDKAVRKTLDLLSQLDIMDETLVIVTGGHGHTMSINGYPNRNESIFGIADKSKHDGIPYTTLTYATGQKTNYQYNRKDNGVYRDDPSLRDTTDINYAQQAAILTDKETHGGGDVTVYATGPMAHLFHSVHEQTYVAHVIAYAARIGPYRVNFAVKSAPTFIGLLYSMVVFVKTF